MAGKADNDGNDEATLLDEKGELRQPDVSRASTLRRFSSDSWFWEILGVVFSLACSIALVVILRECDGHPLPKWRFGITLNAVISVLATAAKGSFLLAIGGALSQYKWLWYRRSQRKLEDFDTFDSASRGPWGALDMLVKINIRNIASIGALITVLSLAFDPFMQQVVVYEPKARHRSNTTFPRSQYFEDQTQTDGYGVSLGLRAALYNGLFDNKAAQQISPSCPTGNCTWPLLSSLAMCSTCKSLPVKSALHCKLTTSGGEYGNAGSELVCNYTFSKFLDGFSAFGSAADGGFTGGTPIQVSALQTASLGFETGDFAFAGKKNPWSGFVKVTLEPVLEVKPISVDVCALYPCIKTYNLSLDDGKTSFQEVNVWSSDKDWTYSNYLVDDQVLSPPRDRVSESSQSTNFTIEFLTVNGILELFQNAFNGSADIPAAPEQQASYTSDIMQALHMTDNITQLMDNMTASVSNHMRDISSDTAIGKVWAMETFVRVRWWWFALPVALAPESCVFLFTAILSSWRGKVEIWKSSGLATMFHGLDNAIQLSQLDRQSGMIDVAKRLNVRLQPTVDGVQRLVGSDGHAAKEHASPLVGSTSVDDSQTARSSTVEQNSETAPFVIPRRPVGSPTSVARTNSQR